MPVEFDPLQMLAVLARHEVEYIVVGGFAARVHGAPIVTEDLDLIFSKDSDNIARLVRALAELHAIYRDPAGRHIEPTEAKLASSSGGGHHLLQTPHGDLDVLRDSGGLTFDDLTSSAVTLEIEGTRTRFASLELIIEMKERAGRPKDLAVLPVLRAVLEDTESE